MKDTAKQRAEVTVLLEQAWTLSEQAGEPVVGYLIERASQADFSPHTGQTKCAYGRLRDITCPVYLLAGVDDDITTKEQVFDAAKYLGTPAGQIVKTLVPGGHIGLFMGARTLSEHWPNIARWIARAQPKAEHSK